MSNAHITTTSIASEENLGLPIVYVQLVSMESNGGSILSEEHIGGPWVVNHGSQPRIKMFPKTRNYKYTSRKRF